MNESSENIKISPNSLTTITSLTSALSFSIEKNVLNKDDPISTERVLHGSKINSVLKADSPTPSKTSSQSPSNLELNQAEKEPITNAPDPQNIRPSPEQLLTPTKVFQSSINMGPRVLDERLARDLIWSVEMVIISFELMQKNCCLEAGSMNLIKKLISLNKEVWLMSTDDSVSRSSIHQWLYERGIRDVDKNRILCTASVTAKIIKNSMNFYGKILCVGSKELNEELQDEGLNSILLEDEETDEKETVQRILNFKIDPEVSCIVLGFDENFTYSKALHVVNYLRNKEIPFIVTDLSTAYSRDPLSKKSELRSIFTFISASAEREPDIIIALPEDHTQKVLASLTTFDPSRTLIIGKRLMPSILFANLSGFHSLLVTGKRSKDLDGLEISPTAEDVYYFPEFVCESIYDFQNHLNQFLNLTDEDFMNL